MTNPRQCIGTIFLPCRPQYRNLDTPISRVFSFSSSALLEDRSQCPSPFVPPAYLAMNARGGRGRQARIRHDLGFWAACSSIYLNLGRGVCSAQIQRGNYLNIAGSSYRNNILSALCIAAPTSRCPCCFAVHPRGSVYGRRTLHFKVLLWREDRLEHPSPFALRTP